jgi:F1F0 ATPase subunit 2
MTDLGSANHAVPILLTDSGLSVLALLGGLAVGWAFFFGLRLTVRALPGSEHPVRLLGISLVLRFALVAGAGWLLLQVGGGWVQILIALAAMMLMRLLILRRSLDPGLDPGAGPGRLRARTLQRAAPRAAADANPSKEPRS